MANNSSRKRSVQNKTCVSDMPNPDMQRLFRKTEEKKSSDSTVRKAIQQHVVEHAERDKALKIIRSPTASKLNSRRLDLCLASRHSWVRTSD